MPELTEEMFCKIMRKLVELDEIDGTCPFSTQCVEIVPTCMQSLSHCIKCNRFSNSEFLLLHASLFPENI